MNIFNKSITDIEYQDVIAFCEQGIKEAANLEYKGAFPSDLAKVVSAFANTFGGIIVIGVPDEDGKPKPPFVGIDYLRGLEEKVTAICVDGIYPPIVPEIRICQNKSEKAFIVVRVHQSQETPHTVHGNTRAYVRTGNISKPEDAITFEQVSWLSNRRNKSEWLREDMYTAAEQHYASLCLFKKAKIEKGEFTFSSCPLYPYQPLLAVEDIESMLVAARTRNNEPDEFPVLYSTLEPLRDGLFHFYHNSQNNYINYLEANRLGLIYQKSSLCWHDKAEDKIKDRIFMVEPMDILDLGLESIGKMYNNIGYWGLVDIKVILSKLEGTVFVPAQPRNTYYIPSRDDKLVLDSTLSWRFTLTVSQLVEPLERQNRLIELLKEMAWSFGYRVSENVIKEKLQERGRQI